MEIQQQKKYDILSQALLLRVGTRPPDEEGRIMAFCPVHGDGKSHGGKGGQSLTLFMDERGEAMIHCYAGCTLGDGYNAVIKALNVNPRDWVVKPAPEKKKQERKLTKLYQYKDYFGEVIAEKGRFENPDNPKDKDFLWRIQGRSWNEGLKPLNIKDIPLWGTDILIDIPKDVPVWFCEGEKATEAVRSAGEIAVCAPGGSGTKDFGKHLDVLKRRPVIIFPDKDEPNPQKKDEPEGGGVAYAKRVAQLLLPIARTVKIVDVQNVDDLPWDGSDAHEWIVELGRKLEELPLREVEFDAAKKRPPYDPMAEAVVLAGMFDVELMMEIISSVRPEDFYTKSHFLIAGAMFELEGDLQDVNPTAVVHKLERSSRLADVGGRQYIESLSRNTPEKSEVMSAVKIVRRDGAWRRMISLGDQLAKWGYTGGEDLEGTIKDAEDMFSDISGKDPGQVRKIYDVIKSDWGYISDFLDDPSRLAGMPTGFYQLDQLLDGLEGGRLYTIGGRTSHGKSMFLANVLTQISAGGIPCLMFAEEMSAEQVVRRMMFGEAEINRLWHRQNNRKVSDVKITALHEASGRLGELPIFFHDTMGSSIQTIRSISRRMVKQHGIKMVAIDHVDLIHNQSKRPELRHQEMAQIYAGLKAMARELDVPVLALSQLSRALERRTDPTPVLADLRESGGKEEDSDVVVFIHHPSKYNDPKKPATNKPAKLWEVIVAKNRDGALGVVDFFGDPGLQKMREWEEEDGPGRRG